MIGNEISSALLEWVLQLYWAYFLRALHFARDPNSLKIIHAKDPTLVQAMKGSVGIMELFSPKVQPAQHRGAVAGQVDT